MKLKMYSTDHVLNNFRNPPAASVLPSFCCDFYACSLAVLYLQALLSLSFRKMPGNCYWEWLLELTEENIWFKRGGLVSMSLWLCDSRRTRRRTHTVPREWLDSTSKVHQWVAKGFRAACYCHQCILWTWCPVASGICHLDLLRFLTGQRETVRADPPEINLSQAPRNREKM